MKHSAIKKVSKTELDAYDFDEEFARLRAESEVREQPGMTWYALVVNPRCDRRAERKLLLHGLCTYRPEGRSWTKPRHSPHVKARLRAAFPRYLFVGHPERSAPEWGVVRSTDGVAGVVGIGWLPCGIPHEKIEFLRRQEEVGRFNYGFDPNAPRSKAQPKYVPGQVLEIISGPYLGYKTPVVRPARQVDVDVELMIFGRSTTLTVPLEMVCEAA